MKTIIKRNLVIFCKPDDWTKLSTKLVEDFGPSILISWRMKRELGFTVRRHRGLVPINIDGTDPQEVIDPNLAYRYRYEQQIHLDFFNEAAHTWFQLKYL
jgi:hypothetical protein